MSRRQAREVSVRWLFEHDLSQTDPQSLLARQDFNLDQPSQAFAEDLLRGVIEHRQELDARIDSLAKAWRVERMSTVDRTILRLGVYELTYFLDIPVGVVLSEAVELTGVYSTPEAKRFVNGVLSAAARELRAHEVH